MPNANHDGIMLLLTFLAVIYGILMFFMPFFIYRIRNEAIKTNKLLRQFIEKISSGPSSVDG